MGRNVRVFPTINLAHPDLAGGTAQQLSPSLLPIPCKKKMVPPEEKCHSQSCWDKILILAGQQEQEWVRVACLCVGWWMAVGGYGGEGSMGVLVLSRIAPRCPRTSCSGHGGERILQWAPLKCSRERCGKTPQALCSWCYHCCLFQSPVNLLGRRKGRRAG